jgi:Tfp pilus assembly protein PilX
MRRASVRFEPTPMSFSAQGEEGVAMLTVLMVMLMLTILGVAAITVSGLENKIAGLQRTTESAAQAAESCLGTGANVIMQTLLPENGDAIPAALLDNASPAGPVPNGNKVTLENEIIGNPENSPDYPSGAGAVPNIVMPAALLTLGGYTVTGDIDRLYVKPRAGTGMKHFAGYEGVGDGGGGDKDIYYKITCVASNTATGTESRVSAIYACTWSPDGCQKQP